MPAEAPSVWLNRMFTTGVSCSASVLDCVTIPVASSTHCSMGCGAATPNHRSVTARMTSGTRAATPTSPFLIWSGTLPKTAAVTTWAQAATTMVSAITKIARTIHRPSMTPAVMPVISDTNIAKGGKPARAKKPIASSTPVATETLWP